MKRLLLFELTICIGLVLLITGCERNATAHENSGTSTTAEVVPGFDPSYFGVDHPEQFPLAIATERMAAPELNVTGSVNPDVSRQVPCRRWPRGESSKSTHGWEMKLARASCCLESEALTSPVLTPTIVRL